MALLAALWWPTVGRADVTTFGSSLSVPATRDTATGLNYPGYNIAVPPTPSHPNGEVHVSHDGADTALWNVALPGGAPTAPASGQILSVRLEGCARPASGGPAPSTQIHFQDLAPTGGGGVHVQVTTNPFDIPVCGDGGATGSTITTYQPTNFCVQRGDYVDFNDEGGFDPQAYPSGVPYQVIGAVSGATMDSFIRSGGTGNGATMSPGDTSDRDGFASNPGEELMLQATLGTGSDATPLCPGGTRAALPAPRALGPGITLRPQTAGVNHSGRVKLALYCGKLKSCSGTVALIATARRLTVGSSAFRARAHATSKIPVYLASSTLALIRRHHRRLAATMVVRLAGGDQVSHGVMLKI